MFSDTMKPTYPTTFNSYIIDSLSGSCLNEYDFSVSEIYNIPKKSNFRIMNLLYTTRRFLQHTAYPWIRSTAMDGKGLTH